MGKRRAALDLTFQYQAPFLVVLIAVLAGGLLFAPIAAGAVHLLARIGHVERWSSHRIPYAVLLIALPYIGLLIATLLLAGNLAPTDLFDTLVPIALGLVIVLLTLLGLLLLGRGRRRPGSLATAGLFYTLIGTAGILAVAKVLGLVFQPRVAIPGLELLVAPATLAILLWLALRRQINAQRTDLLVRLFALIVALQVITWYIDLFVGVASFSDSVLVAAVSLIGAQAWDLLMSGEQVTNINGRRFPRNTRIFLYCGYVMLISTLALYFSSLKGSDPLNGGMFNSDGISLFGLALVGVPLVVTGFILAYGRWHTPSGQPSAAPAPLGAESASVPPL